MNPPLCRKYHFARPNLHHRSPFNPVPRVAAIGIFELISACYERRSLMIVAHEPFGKWNRVFPDETAAVAALDRPVHHATILKMNVESYRCGQALDRNKRKRGHPAGHTTQKSVKDRTGRRLQLGRPALSPMAWEDRRREPPLLTLPIGTDTAAPPPVERIIQTDAL